MAAAMTVVEMARVDASCSTFLMVHNSLCMLTIGLLGSEQQKQELLPSLASLDKIGEHPCSNMWTSAVKQDGATNGMTHSHTY